MSHPDPTKTYEDETIEDKYKADAYVEKEIVPTENQVVKFDPEQDIKQGQKAAKALMKVVEITKPLKLNGKTYLYFEHWQTMAKFFKMSVGIEWTKQTDMGWDAKAIVYQNGIIIGGAEASCNKDEKNWSIRTNKFSGKTEEVPDFQRKSMAQTRAMSKALRSILGYIPVLAGIEPTPAEEIEPPRKEEVDINKLVPGTPPVNLIGKDYERYAEKIQSSKTLKELEAWGNNIKFLGKTINNHERSMLREVYKKKKLALQKEVVIEAEDLPPTILNRIPK